jgi:hypothetical protein
MRYALLLGFLASCGPRLDPRPEAIPVDPALLHGTWRAEVEEILAALEKSFYRHWGSVETTAEYGRLRARDHAWILRQVADANAEHALMAVRVLAKLAPEERFSDDARAILYVSALEREQNFARWGSISKGGFLPGVYGMELLALKAAAAPYLRRLLADKRRARVVGGEAGGTNAIQGDRVCDYAWVLLATILDRPIGYHPDPEKRDPQIRELDLWLDRRR